MVTSQILNYNSHSSYHIEAYDESIKNVPSICPTTVEAYIKSFGNGKPVSALCEGTSCIHLGEDIKACQLIGTKVLVSLGEPFNTYSLKSVDDAKVVAKQLWDSYVDEVNFDGIDFRIENGSALYYEYLAQPLKDYATKNNKEIILSAFPGCVYPDEYLARAINAWNLTVHDKTKLFLGIPVTKDIPGFILFDRLIDTVIPHISDETQD
ncbi:acidic endochitinase-like [Ziziphus jujuba]|uniref:Acidic endochitinase-like n=1 Tax=Ziziphus jujuba TaxID=326968 RepID=A0ABM4AAZ5_ZIZJJ|nr:acidic endochitinase-like [Ziziphus jujuba]